MHKGSRQYSLIQLEKIRTSVGLHINIFKLAITTVIKMLYLHHTCLCINRLKSKLYTFRNKMAFLYFLLICELLVYKTISRFQGPPFPFRNYSARTVHAQPEPSISPEQHSALEKWAFAQTAPRLSIHFREMHHRQNRTYFGGPRLQAVGITSNEKSHFLGWEKKVSFLK